MGVYSPPSVDWGALVSARGGVATKNNTVLMESFGQTGPRSCWGDQKNFSPPFERFLERMPAFTNYNEVEWGGDPVDCFTVFLVPDFSVNPPPDIFLRSLGPQDFFPMHHSSLKAGFSFFCGSFVVCVLGGFIVPGTLFRTFRGSFVIALRFFSGPFVVSCLGADHPPPSVSTSLVSLLPPLPDTVRTTGTYSLSPA